MSDDQTTGPTRRDALKYGGTLVAGGLLAGCSGEGDPASETADPTVTETATDDATPTESSPTATPQEETGYSVTMEPVGTVEFDAVPEEWFAYTGDYADMGVALGQADGLSAIGVGRRFGSHRYDELPGVSVDKGELTELWQDGTDKELFYDLDADVHVIDPNFMIHRLQWSQADVEEIRDNVAPFVGNTSFTQVYGWHDYTHYSLYDAFEKVADVFQERDRYEAFKAYHDDVLASVRSRLPDERPEVAIVVPADVPPDQFWPYRIGDGIQSKHWNDLNAVDALADTDVTDAQAGGGRIDYERLLEIDPDVIAIRLAGELTQQWVDENVTAHLKDQAVASELSAVQNDRVIYGGMTYQGPIIHLFQLETAAQGLYPAEFGGEQLFDRQRVADIITGSS